MTKNIFFWLTVVLFTSACKEQSKYDGFSVTPTGLNYKIHSLGDVDQNLNDSDVISYVILVQSKMGDTVVPAKIVNQKLYLTQKDSGLMELLGELNIGDSASYIQKQDMVEQLVTCKLLSATPYNIWAYYQKYPELQSDVEIQEQERLYALLNKFERDSIQNIGGMYVIHQIKGSGSFPAKGDEVVFDLVGRNAKEEIIESTIQMGEPFSYVLGNPDQVIPGVDYGIRRMKRGGKAIFIIPSNLAYGENGSSTGIVKPYESLMYEIELHEIIN